jgi:hypothetical protein
VKATNPPSEIVERKPEVKSTVSVASRQHDNKQSSKPSSYRASKLSDYPDSIVESIRKAVKYVGKEAFFGRFTPEEKRMMADIAYTYKRSGMKTSENEIARIAVNFIVADYNANGKNSLLEQVIAALNE